MPLYKDFAVDYKDGEQDDGGYIVAYASTFDMEPDSYGDIVKKGAFAKSLQKHNEENEQIQFLFGHRTDDPIYNIGLITNAEEDDHGLLIEAKFDPENEKAQYARKLVKEGRLKKLSFAYDVKDQATVQLPDGRKVNELREVDIFEVSLVPIPANQNAQVVYAKDANQGSDLDHSSEVIEETKSDELNDHTEDNHDGIKDVETHIKAGRVLSAKNQDDLEKAVGLIQGVLSQLDAASNDSEEPKNEQKKGDPSSAEASADGGKGASEVDAEFLAKYTEYLTKGI